MLVGGNISFFSLPVCVSCVSAVRQRVAWTDDDVIQSFFFKFRSVRNFRGGKSLHVAPRLWVFKVVVWGYWGKMSQTWPLKSVHNRNSMGRWTTLHLIDQNGVYISIYQPGETRNNRPIEFSFGVCIANEWTCGVSERCCCCVEFQEVSVQDAFFASIGLSSFNKKKKTF